MSKTTVKNYGKGNCDSNRTRLPRMGIRMLDHNLQSTALAMILATLLLMGLEL